MDAHWGHERNRTAAGSAAATFALPGQVRAPTLPSVARSSHGLYSAGTAPIVLRGGSPLFEHSGTDNAEGSIGNLRSKGASRPEKLPFTTRRGEPRRRMYPLQVNLISPSRFERCCGRAGRGPLGS